MGGFAVPAFLELAGNMVMICAAALFSRACKAHAPWGPWAVLTGMQAPVFAAIRWRDEAAVAAVTAAFCAWMWFRRRRKDRDRVPRSYGAKSKALIAGLVKRARDAARPRPVFRPSPQGAPA